MIERPPVLQTKAAIVQGEAHAFCYQEELRGNEEDDEVQNHPDQELDGPQGRMHHDAWVRVVRGADGEEGDHRVEYCGGESYSQHKRPSHACGRLLVRRAPQVFAAVGSAPSMRT